MAMLDEKTFSRLYAEHHETIRRVFMRKGFRDADLEEATQELWGFIWARRASWPDPVYPRAFLVTAAKNAAWNRNRDRMAKKRAAVHVQLPEDRSSATGVPVGVEPAVFETLEQTSLSDLMRRLAKKVGGKRGKALLQHLSHETAFPEDASSLKRLLPRAVQGARKRLGFAEGKAPMLSRNEAFEQLSERLRMLSLENLSAESE